jgi:hypothetical protein
MNARRQRRIAGSLAILIYLCGCLGSAAGAVAALLGGAGSSAGSGACGCTEGDACCGAACCAPAVAAETPSCCGGEPDPPSEPVLAMVARCTCGHRDHHAALACGYDLHLPSAARVGAGPPAVAHHHPLLRLAVPSRQPEPRDQVPKVRGSFA